MFIAVAAQAQADNGVSLLELIPSLVGATAAALALAGATRSLYLRTIGRRRDRYARLTRLGVGAQLLFFSSVLGEPAAMRYRLQKDDYRIALRLGDPGFDPERAQWKPVPRDFIISVFIDRDYYVQAVCDCDETVLAYSVTSRSPRFRPRFQPVWSPGVIGRWRRRIRHMTRYPRPLSVKLGRTCFADLDPAEGDNFRPPHFMLRLGAHNFDYSEFNYFGNPGKYQFFVWTASDASLHSVPKGLGPAQAELGGAREWPDPDGAPEPDWEQMPAVAKLRREAVITTYTVISASLSLENYPLARFGPNHNDVRTLG